MDKPFYAEIQQLFANVRDRAGWEAWFRGLFAQLNTMQAQTWSEITN